MSGQVARWVGAKLERRIACWSACLSLALTLAVGGTALAVIGSLLLDDAREHLEHDATVVQVQLELALRTFLGDTAELASSSLVVAALSEPQGRDSHLARFFAGHHTGEARPALLVLTDFEGRTIAANRAADAKSPPRSYRLLPWIAQVIDHGQSILQTTPPGAGEAAVLLAAYPVIVPATGRPEGALVGEMALDAVLKQAAELLPAGMPAELRSGSGEVLAAIGAFSGAADLMIVERPLRLAELPGGLSPVLRVGVDRQAALVSVRRLLPVVAAAGIVLALLVFGLAALMGRRLSRPIGELAEAAGGITGEAPFDEVSIKSIAEIRRGDEVGDLARAFAGMLGRLHHLYADLEQQVERRTRALSRAQAELAQVLASVEDVICSFSPGLERIHYINPAIERVTGLAREDFLTQPDLLRTIIDPADRDGWDASLAGLGPETPSAQAVFRVVGPSGARRWFYGRYQLVCRGEDGQPVIDSIVADITERRVAELAVAGSEARLRAIFETVGDSIITIDSFGFIEGVNSAACRLFGYEADEMTGRNVTMLMPERLRAAHDGYIRRYLETGVGRVVGVGREVVGLRRGGEEFPAELAVGVLRPEDADPLFVGVIRDITERNRTQDALRAAKEQAEAAGNAKTEFLAVMSHEIRTPLNGVLGMIGLLEDGELPAESRRYVDAARRSSEALLTILNDILDFSKMEAGHLDLVVGALDIGGLARDLVEELGPRAREKAIALTAEIAPGVPALMPGDQGRVRQVLLNLVSNAVKFTHSGGVRVRVAPEGERVRVSVIDSGIGISEEAQGRLFNRFSQVDSSTSRRYGGTGLGLAIARKLVIMMAGEIGVDSTPGAGSSFWFTLPGGVVPVSESPPSSPAEGRSGGFAARPSPSRSAGGSILLVEDSETNRLVATTILEKAGYRVETAVDGAAAVGVVAAGGFDLVLMDVAMPEMDGFQATAAIRALADGATAAVPIIALTANAMVGDRARCLEAGMDDYLPKPLPKAQLLAMVERFLGRPESPPPAAPLAPATANQISGMLRGLINDIPAEALSHIIDTFIADARVRLGRMAEALDGRDIETLEREAHPVKSSSRTFGLEALGSRAEQVEVACRAGKPDQAVALTRELIAHSEDAFVSLRAELAKIAASS